MKRLTDAQIASGYDRRPGAPNAKSLHTDHLQARSDRERLVGALQSRVNDCCTSANRCMWCIRDLALLAEVDP